MRTTIKPASWIKRYRRTPEEMEQCRAAVKEELEKAEEEIPVTLRRLYYLLVSRTDLVSQRALGADGKPLRLIPKTEDAYDNLSVMLCDLRERGDVPWELITDNTRALDVPATYLNVEDHLESALRTHGLDPWLDQPNLVYVTCEKNAIQNILAEVTYPYVVPLGVIRGFSSRTFLHEIAMHIVEVGKPTYFFHLGDHDLAGFHIASSSQRLLTKYVAKRVELQFERLAVTPEQIDEYRLPTRPPKAGDKPNKELGYDGRAVEVDALPMNVIRDLTRDAIETVLDREVYEETLQRQDRDIALFRKIVAMYRRQN